MSKSNRKEILKRLTEEIKNTTDPKQLAELTRQFNKLSSLKKEKRASSRAETTTPSNTKLSIIDRVTGSAVDTLSDGRKVINWLVCEVEKMQREQHRKFTAEERKAMFDKLIAGLSARDRAALESADTRNPKE
jgi:hypothetical protein